MAESRGIERSDVKKALFEIVDEIRADVKSGSFDGVQKSTQFAILHEAGQKGSFIPSFVIVPLILSVFSISLFKVPSGFIGVNIILTLFTLFLMFMMKSRHPYAYIEELAGKAIEEEYRLAVSEAVFGKLDKEAYNALVSKIYFSGFILMIVLSAFTYQRAVDLITLAPILVYLLFLISTMKIFWRKYLDY